jgi:hypothetical protein
MRFHAGVIAAANSLRMLRIAGQSNGMGPGSTVLSATPSTRHKRFTPGVRCQNTGLTPLIPLVEQADSFGGGATAGETLATAFAEMHDLLTGNADRWLISNHALSSQTISGIKKGGTSSAYAYGQAQTMAAVGASMGITVAGVAFIHGETDAQLNTTGYPADLETLQNDEDTDTKAITGQTSEVIFYCTQCASCPPGSTNATGATKTGSTHLTVLAKAIALPTRFVCVGPTYFARFVSDGLHYTAGFTRLLGAYVAKALKKMEAGADALPLYPTAAVRTGTSVVVTFHVPVAPLVWHLDLFQNTTSGNTGALLGFKFYDDSGSPPAITDVQITAADQVTVTLASTPTGTQASQEIRIGHSTSQASGSGGTALADSDPAVDPRGWPLPNLCCMSYIPVTL